MGEVKTYEYTFSTKKLYLHLQHTRRLNFWSKKDDLSIASTQTMYAVYLWQKNLAYVINHSLQAKGWPNLHNNTAMKLKSELESKKHCSFNIIPVNGCNSCFLNDE